MSKRSWLTTIVTTVAVCVVSLAAAVFTACSAGKSSFDVSAGEGSGVTVELVEKGGNRYKLVVSGTGKMKDYVNSEDAPWYGKAKLIDEIEIKEGVTAIGRNAFRGAKVDGIVLPASVTEIGHTIADEGILICSVGTGTVTSADEKVTIYPYSENAPATADKYWVKDVTEGDIITAPAEDAEPVVEKQYWHYADGKISVWEKKKVLFIGNSYTFRNGTTGSYDNGGVARLFDSIADSVGCYVETYAILGSALSLNTHADASSATGAQIELLLNTVKDLDYVVLQEQSTMPVNRYKNYLDGATALKEKIDATQSKAKIYLYETWGSPKAIENTTETVQSFERKLNKACNKVALELDGLGISPVGRAFTYIYNDADHDIGLWADDNTHQSYAGAYLSACVHVCSILGGDVRNSAFKRTAEFNDAELSDEVLAYLRNTAYAVVNNDSIIIDSDMEVVSSPLKIAVWGRYISETNMGKVLSAFGEYCELNGLGTSLISYDYYEGTESGSAYYTVANYSAAVKEAGADVLFPVGNNINSAGNYDTITNDSKASLGTVFGQTSRYVALGSNEASNMARAFFTWCTSDDAKALFDPKDDAPDTPDVPDVPVTVGYDLDIAVWGRYVDEAQFVLVFEAFKAYCTELKIYTENFHYTYFESPTVTSADSYFNVGNFAAAIKAADGTPLYDIVFGGGTNMKDNVTVVDEVTLTTTLYRKVNADKTNENNNRLVNRTKGTALSYLFAQFCLSDAGVAAIAGYTSAPTPLVVGWYAKTNTTGLTQEMMTAYEEALKAYIQTANLGKVSVTIRKYESSLNVEAVGTAVNGHGDVNILIGMGGNITNTGKIETKELVEDYKIGEKTRNIARLTEDSLTVAVYDWMKTDAARAIFSGETTPPETPPETPPVPAETAIVIGWYAKTNTTGLTQAMMTAFETALRAYLATDYASVTVTIREYASSLNVEAVGTAVNGHGDVNILIGMGGNITNTGKIETEALVDYTIGGKARNIARLTTGPVAQAIFTWMQTDEVKAIFNPAA